MVEFRGEILSMDEVEYART